MSERSMYLALGLEPGAPSAEIKRAYRNLSLRFHPDASRDPRTAKRFAVVAKAYEVLSVRERDRPGINTASVVDRECFDIFALGAELATNSDPERRRRAAAKLGLSGKRSAWVFLRKGLYDDAPEVVAACVRAAAALAIAQGAGEIAGAYERASPPLRDEILEIAKATRDSLFVATLEVASNDLDHRRSSLATMLQRSLSAVLSSP
ncbi:MAG: DnaJ domain-containing protein [Spirochaetales bacterium]|nr:DnaJ domain-containing protein [Spirochaetales bacterium]